MLEQIRQLAADAKIKFTLLAREEMSADSVGTDGVLKALASDRTEMIEDYPNDRRGHSHLLLCWLGVRRPLHICCAIHDGELVVITVYCPAENYWMPDWRTRK